MIIKIIEKIKNYLKQLFSKKEVPLLIEGTELQDQDIKLEYNEIPSVSKDEFFEIYNNVKKGVISIEDLMITDMIKVMQMMQSEEKILDGNIININGMY